MTVDIKDPELAKALEEYGSVVTSDEDGNLILIDSTAHAIATVVAKYNCINTFQSFAERIAHFKNRMNELGKTPEEVVIMLIKVDDPHGGPIADTLMPNEDWQEQRDQGFIPFARGLVTKKGIQDILSDFDQEAAGKLAEMKDLAVVVVDHGVAEIFAA